MTYSKNSDQYDEIWRVETLFRHSGGFVLTNTSSIPEKGDMLKAGTPLAVDFAKRTAEVTYEGSEKRPNALLYAPVSCADGESVTAVGGALEIREAKLPMKLSLEDKASLGSRFQFV